MNLFEHFYLNFYGLSLLGGMISWTFAVIFIFLLKQKSKPTKFLAWNIFAGSITYYAYMVSQSFYEPYMTVRILALIPILFFYPLQSYFLLNFPTEVSSRFQKITVSINFSSAILVSIVIIISSLKAKVVYKFDGHFFDFDMPVAIKIYGFAVLYFVFYTLAITIWRFIKAPAQDKYYAGFIILGVFIEGVPSAVLNVLNRLGLVSRQFFFTFYVLFVMLGIFIILISYINRTRDKTSFMFKITSISFLILIMIFNFYSYIIMNFAEKQYDSKQTDQAASIIFQKMYPEDLSYVVEYKIDQTDLNYLYNKNGEKVIEKELIELQNSYFLAKFSQKRVSEISDKDIKEMISKGGFEYTHSYIQLLLNNRNVENYKNLYVSEFFHNFQRAIFSLQSHVYDLKSDNFRTELIHLIEKSPKEIEPILKVLQSQLEKSLKEKEELKTEILFYLQDIKPLKARKYIKTSQNAYVRYHVYFPDKPGYIYELGYSYLHYRTFIHNIAKEIFYVFLISIIIAVFGTPIFLSGSLVKPLNAVLGGLKQVQEGNLNTSVPVYVQDEIGFLASSFNKMVTSIREGKAKLEEYSLSLEDKVEERTKELLVSYREIENLKEQQDGDYFLTTLLLSPLSINREISQRKILIDFFVKQKKEFQFRKRKHEIGGDICIAHDLKLKGKWYTAFLNADAMGKSMQGAGGVLVLGAVFQSILQRTATYKEQSEVYPEIWIKAAFKEMHKIFESFDGSMLISLIFGLVEEDTGLVYYINAEHPWLILYRDGKADFIEHELYFRKLGTSGMSNSLFVSTFQMMPGDMLIMGSDGKDDLLISNAENTRIINEDETYFLKHVEESNGDLNDIFKAITEKYELIDDFSLLSIQYPLLEEDLETKQKALEFIRKARNEIRNKMDDKALSTLEYGYIQTNKHPIIGRALTKLYLKLHNFPKAAETSREYIQNNPVDTPLMIQTSYSLKLNHEFSEAIEIAERVKLREPSNLRNLVHLADLYTYTRNYDKAKKTLNKIFTIDSNNLKAKRIQEILISESSGNKNLQKT